METRGRRDLSSSRARSSNALPRLDCIPGYENVLVSAPRFRDDVDLLSDERSSDAARKRDVRRSGSATRDPNGRCHPKVWRHSSADRRLRSGGDEWVKLSTEGQKIVGLLATKTDGKAGASARKFFFVRPPIHRGEGRPDPVEVRRRETTIPASSVRKSRRPRRFLEMEFRRIARPYPADSANGSVDGTTRERDAESKRFFDPPFETRERTEERDDRDLPADPATLSSARTDGNDPSLPKGPLFLEARRAFLSRRCV